jgi:hemerythrin-like domain-containing protein
VNAKEGDVKGVDGAVDRIIKMMEELVTFYPQHIEKEDKDFFPASMKYLDEQEEQEMLEEEYEFDKNFIHVLYKDIVEDAENRFK